MLTPRMFIPSSSLSLALLAASLEESNQAIEAEPFPPVLPLHSQGLRDVVVFC